MEQGLLVYLKSSEEPVVVIATDGIQDHPTQSITVRRPIMGRDGTRYELADFFRFELETAEEQDIRKIDDIKRRHKLTQQAQADIPVVPQFDFAHATDPSTPRN